MTRWLTGVLVGELPGRVRSSLRFAHPFKEVHQRDGSRCAYFAPGAVLCRLCTESGPRRLARRLEVLRAVHPDERCSELVGVAPGAQILLRTDTAQAVGRVLALIAEIERQGVRPHAVSAAYWRVIHNRIRAGIDLVPFSIASHSASRQRLRLYP